MSWGRLKKDLFTIKKKIWCDWRSNKSSATSGLAPHLDRETTEQVNQRLLAQRVLMTHSSTFLRHEVRRNLVVSTCALCQRTVASGNERLLRVAETAHSCPKLRHFEDAEEFPQAKRKLRSAGS